MNWIFNGGEMHRSISERRFSPFLSLFPGAVNMLIKRPKKLAKIGSK